jgi:ATP-binding cassette subfamily C protein LapB
VEGSVALLPTNLRILPGERIAIIGPVGSGKSTLIKLLTGLYKPTEGRAFLDGIDMAQLAPEFMREHIGYLTQDVRLFHGTLRENLTLGLPSPTDGQILAAAERTGLDRLIKAHPKGLELPILEGGRGLSGGQRQLVGLTRLLLAKPRVLILDEPTAAMDGDLESYVMHNMFTMTPTDSVILLATHKRTMLKLVSRIIVVDQGRIMLDAPRDEALARLNSQTPRRAKPQQDQPAQPGTGETA